jgi:hypothetical protein
MSLSKVWNENERFSLVFTKMLVFVPKTGSLHTGTGKKGDKRLENQGVRDGDVKGIDRSFELRGESRLI